MRFQSSRLERGAFRVSPIGALGAISIVVVLGILFLSPESPQTAGARFMDALARHDVKTLAANSFMEGLDEQQMGQRWEATVKGPARYYRFTWKVTGTVQASPDKAAMQMMVMRDSDYATSYEEKYELPLVNVKGKWKVDVRRLDRRIFPYLPR